MKLALYIYNKNLYDMFLARNSALWCVWVIGQRFTLALSKSWENFIYVLASTWQPSASYNPLIKICHGYVICQISVQNPSSGFPNKVSQTFSNRIKKKKKTVTESQKWTILRIEMPCVILANITFNIKRETILAFWQILHNDGQHER